VGDQPILAGDLLGQVNQIIEANKDKIPEHQMDEIRETVIKQALKSAIETKLLYLDFLRTVPADKIPEIEKNVLEQYDKSQLEQTIASAGVGSAAELDAKLRSYGSSLSKMKRSFAERVMASEMLKRNVTKQPEVTHLEMLDYYREHADSFAIPAQTRWEQLMVRFDKSPSKAEAWIAIAQMGNAVLGGAPFAAVARRSSHGFMAQEGGQHDWTTKGSLKSTVLDEAIFSLPLDRLSQILEDEDGFHIIRVIERRETGRVPFTEAQVDIKEKLIESKKQDDGKAYLERLRKQTLVWTVFDDEDVQPQARAPQQSIGS
jgi:parvulin-like peptidyl-prolyl isomerase